MCEVKVSYYIPHGFDYKEVSVKCGNTDPYGGQALCDKHINNPDIKEHQESVDADNAWLRSAGWGEM
jgi:hypothetical protein